MMLTVLSEKKPFGKGQEGVIGYNIRLAKISPMSRALAQIENLLTAHYGDEVMRRTNGRYTYLRIRGNEVSTDTVWVP